MMAATPYLSRWALVPARRRSLGSPCEAIKPFGAPSRAGASAHVQAQRGRAVCVYANALDAPSAGGPQGGEGLADPAVLGFLEVVGQDSLLVLQLLHQTANT